MVKIQKINLMEKVFGEDSSRSEQEKSTWAPKKPICRINDEKIPLSFLQLLVSQKGKLDQVEEKNL